MTISSGSPDLYFFFIQPSLVLGLYMIVVKN